MAVLSFENKIMKSRLKVESRADSDQSVITIDSQPQSDQPIRQIPTDQSATIRPTSQPQSALPSAPNIYYDSNVERKIELRREEKEIIKEKSEIHTQKIEPAQIEIPQTPTVAIQPVTNCNSFSQPQPLVQETKPMINLTPFPEPPEEELSLEEQTLERIQKHLGIYNNIRFCNLDKHSKDLEEIRMFLARTREADFAGQKRGEKPMLRQQADLAIEYCKINPSQSIKSISQMLFYASNMAKNQPIGVHEVPSHQHFKDIYKQALINQSEINKANEEKLNLCQNLTIN